MKRDRLTNFLLGLLAVLLAGIGAKVWQGVEIARENQMLGERRAEDIRENRADARELRDDLVELRSDVKWLRSDLDRLYEGMNNLATGEQP